MDRCGQSHKLNVSALAFRFLAAEFAAPVWTNSLQTKKIDIAINKTVIIVILYI